MKYFCYDLIHMTGYSVRLPQGIVDAIDLQIKEKEYFSTRPDFVLFAMKSTAMIMADRYRKMLEMIDGNESMRYMKGQEKLLVSRVGESLLEVFNGRFGGDPVQIMIRIPEGLNRIIEDFVIRIGYVTNKLDYIRLSIVCTLESLDEMEQIMAGAEEYTRNVKKAQEDLIRAVAGDLIGGDGSVDVIRRVVDANVNVSQKGKR